MIGTINNINKPNDVEASTMSPTLTFSSSQSVPSPPPSGIEVEFDEARLGTSKSFQVSDRDDASGCCCCSRSRLKHCGFLLFLLIVLGVGLSVAFFDNPNPATFFVQQDPPGQNETHPWGTNGKGGLDLTIINALEDRWTPYLEDEVRKWDTGTPDALTLDIVREEPDPSCSPSLGRLKVCNGDYGETGWRGLNINVLRHGNVVHSVAKMNEFYLARERKAHWTYTMCHELGHGFGLPHTDEIYFNLDRGDCMDYTVRPFLNSRPGKFNFELLAALYGTVPPEAGTSSVASPVARPNNSGGRWLRAEKIRRQLGSPSVDGEIPDTVTAKYMNLVDEIGQQRCARQRRCDFHLQGGYTMEVHQLLVN